jgi:hypothetical protein
MHIHGIHTSTCTKETRVRHRTTRRWPLDFPSTDPLPPFHFVVRAMKNVVVMIIVLLVAAQELLPCTGSPPSRVMGTAFAVVGSKWSPTTTIATTTLIAKTSRICPHGDRCTSLSLVLSPQVSSSSGRRRKSRSQLCLLHKSNENNMDNNNMVRVVDIQTPSSEEAASMGIREWPQQVKSKGTSWSEEVNTDTNVVRYILDGTGTLEICSVVDPRKVEEDAKPTRRECTTIVEPGTLIQVQGPATLRWMALDEMIVLTPGFEEGGLFAGVIVAVLALFGALMVGTTSGSF